MICEERKEVGWIEKKFTDKIMTQHMMDALKCKQHDGPVTATKIEKLSHLQKVRLSLRLSFLKTTAPNIRLKHKVG